MQKIKLMELELETKIMSDAGERAVKEEKLQNLEKAMASFDKVKGKLERKLTSVQDDLKRAYEEKYQDSKDMKQKIMDQSKQIVELQVALVYEKEKAKMF